MRIVNMLIVSLFAIIAHLNCGSNVSGGAGAGNPVTVAVIAESSDTSATTRELLRSEIIIPDSGKAIISINEMQLYTECITVFTNVDSTKMSDGPFVFDILSGDCEKYNNLDIYTIPDGAYEKIKFCFPDYTDSVYQIEIKGSINVSGEKHNVKIFIHAKNSVFFNADSTIDVAGGEPVDFIVKLNDQEWFKDVNIKGCFNNDAYTVDSLGTLLIYDNKYSLGPNGKLAARIRTNIINSGTLKRK